MFTLWNVGPCFARLRVEFRRYLDDKQPYKDLCDWMQNNSDEFLSEIAQKILDECLSDMGQYTVFTFYHIIKDLQDRQPFDTDLCDMPQDEVEKLRMCKLFYNKLERMYAAAKVMAKQRKSEALRQQGDSLFS